MLNISVMTPEVEFMELNISIVLSVLMIPKYRIWPDCRKWYFMKINFYESTGPLLRIYSSKFKIVVTTPVVEVKKLYR